LFILPFEGECFGRRRVFQLQECADALQLKGEGGWLSPTVIEAVQVVKGTAFL